MIIYSKMEPEQEIHFNAPTVQNLSKISIFLLIMSVGNFSTARFVLYKWAFSVQFSWHVDLWADSAHSLQALIRCDFHDPNSGTFRQRLLHRSICEIVRLNPLLCHSNHCWFSFNQYIVKSATLWIRMCSGLCANRHSRLAEGVLFMDPMVANIAVLCTLISSFTYNIMYV